MGSTTVAPTIFIGVSTLIVWYELSDCASCFGLEGAKKRKENQDKPKQLAQNDNSYQTIRVETPIKIIGATVVDPKTKT